MSLLPELRGYTATKLLGVGGMGEVYAGQDTATGQDVAIKVLLTESPSEAWRRRFEREAHAMMSLQHPNLCQAYNFGSLDNGRLFLVLELLSGEDLGCKLGRKGRLEPAEVIRIGQLAAAGLEAVHLEGLVHRDIKPSNIFLQTNPDGEPFVKVLDFGLAIMGSGDDLDTRVTLTGEVVGTPSYMSPEQAQGGRTEDHRSDIYSLGSVLYRALTGRPPLGVGNALEIIYRLVTQEPEHITAICPDLPQSLADVIMRSIARDREDRPQSMAELGRLLSEQSTVAAGIDSTVAVLDRTLAPAEVEELREEKRVVTALVANGVSDVKTVIGLLKRYGGQTMILGGNQVAGFFGHQIGEGDEAQRAVRAALKVNELCTMVGVGTGHVVGAGGRVAGGDAISSAQEITVQIESGVHVDAATSARVSSHFNVQDGQVVGEISEVDDTAELPFVGRSVEMSELVGRAQRAFDDEEPGALMITGPPGIGKSRLIREFERHMNEITDGTLVMVGRCESAHSYTPWHLMSRLLQSYLDVSVAQSGAECVKDILSKVAGVGIDSETAYILAAVLGVPLPEGVSPRLDGAIHDAQLMRDQTVQALGDFFDALAQTQPLLLLLEDVHWADRASLESVEVVLRRLDDVPLFVVMTGRHHAASERSDLLNGPEVHPMALRELSKKAAHQLAQLVGVDEQVARQVATHTGGNPLFVRELAGALQEGSSLDATGHTVELPVSIEAAVQSRLDHLVADEKSLLKRAAVCGLSFSREAVAALGARSVARCLDRLKRQNLVARSKSAGEAGDIVFRHAVVRDVAYGMLTEDQRQRLHCRYGRWIVDTGGHSADAAYHFTLGQASEDALPLWSNAADDAERDGDLVAATHCLEQALKAVIDDENHELALRLRRLAVATHACLLEASNVELVELERLEPLCDERQRADLAYWRAGVLRWKNDYQESCGHLSDAIEGYRALGDDAGVSSALASLAISRCYGRLGPARELAAEAVSAAGDDLHSRARALHCQMVVELREVALRSARELGSTALAACEEAGDLRRSMEVLVSIAYIDKQLGQFDQASEQLRDIVQRSQKIGSRNVEGYARHNLGLALLYLGDVDNALLEESRALAVARALGDTRLEAYTLMYLSVIYLEQGEVEQAAETAAQARPLVANGASEPTARAVSALVCLARGDFAEGLNEADKAIKLRTEMGVLEEFEAELLWARAELLQHLGRVEEAALQLEEARAFVLSRVDDLTQNSEERAMYLSAFPTHRKLMEDHPTE